MLHFFIEGGIGTFTVPFILVKTRFILTMFLKLLASEIVLNSLQTPLMLKVNY